MQKLEQIQPALEKSAAATQWAQIGIKHHHGLAVPLFSLKDEQCAGIGEYPSLYRLIDWCQQIGMDVIQLLPLNDTGIDQSPYNAISAFALNPLFIGLVELPRIHQHADLQSLIENLQELTTKPRIDYPLVRTGKMKFLRIYFQREFAQIRHTKEYEQFLNENSWLPGYALFKALKLTHDWHNWESWEPALKHPSALTFQKLTEEYEEEIHFQNFLQFLCFQQMEKVKRYATTHGVFIKGDIPILISRDSADVWQHPDLFNLAFSAGAPPDMYSDQGQNWGFPIYDWAAMEKQNYSWYRQRLQVAERIYHIYRIDHIVGFFHLWSIPVKKGGGPGYYLPQDKNSWIPQGDTLMRMMLSSSRMLPIGEDLGNVPPSVREHLAFLGICGTKVMRWERKWDEDRRFIKITDYNPVSMTTVSTHDSETVQLWWKNQPSEAREFCAFKGWHYQPTITTEQQRELLWDSHHTTSLFHINLLNEYLALFPELVHADPLQERINIPGTIDKNNWSYRLLPSVEQLVDHAPLKQTIRMLTAM